MTILFVLSIMLTSCYSYKSVVGDGANDQSKVKTTEWNHYMLYGLIPLKVSDSKVMANEATNYTVHTRQSVFNGIITGVTLGIYSPTVTTVETVTTAEK
ncbi:MAG: Bor family protein [Bacteroidetes bacterium]|nr:Bor family protein [Bacteroidota bacterium]